jgi:hypothetical protein
LKERKDAEGEEMEGHHMHACEDSTMKPTKHSLKERRGGKGGIEIR